MALDQDTVLQHLLRMRGVLIGYIVSVVRDWQVAEDVFQEVSLTAVRKADAIESVAALPTWLRSAARFAALNAVRSRQRRAEVFDDEVLDLLDEQWLAEEEQEGSVQTLEALRKCMEKLSPTSSRLVSLRYHEGLCGKSLAERIGRPLNTVYVGLTRAHRFLAGCVKTRMISEGHRHE